MMGTHGFVGGVVPVPATQEQRKKETGFTDKAEAFLALNEPTQGWYVPSSCREQLPSALGYQM